MPFRGMGWIISFNSARVGGFRRISLGRFSLALVTGGTLLQITGCLSGLTPTVLSLAESIVLWNLFTNL